MRLKTLRLNRRRVMAAERHLHISVGPNPKKAVLKPVSGRELEESPKAFIYVWLGQRSTLVEWLRLKRALGPDIVILLEF